MIENVTLEKAPGVYLLLDFTTRDSVTVDGITFTHYRDTDGSEYIGVEGDWIEEIPVKSGNILEEYGESGLPNFRMSGWNVHFVSIRTTHYHWCHSVGWIKNR